jgi:hypothetical protein
MSCTQTQDPVSAGSGECCAVLFAIEMDWEEVTRSASPMRRYATQPSHYVGDRSMMNDAVQFGEPSQHQLRGKEGGFAACM